MNDNGGNSDDADDHEDTTVNIGTYVAAKVAVLSGRQELSVKGKVFIGKVIESFDDCDYTISFLKMNKFGF